MNEAHFSRRIGRSIGAVLAGMFAGIILTLGTDVVLHAIHVFPPWGLSCSQRSIALSTVFWAATSSRALRPIGPCSTPWWADSSALS